MREAEEARRYLRVPYAEKEEAKLVGARWDPLVKLWYVPRYVPFANVKRWIIRGHNPALPQVDRNQGNERHFYQQAKG